MKPIQHKEHSKEEIGQMIKKAIEAEGEPPPTIMEVFNRIRISAEENVLYILIGYWIGEWLFR